MNTEHPRKQSSADLVSDRLWYQTNKIAELESLLAYALAEKEQAERELVECRAQLGRGADGTLVVPMVKCESCHTYLVVNRPCRCASKGDKS